MNLNEKIAARLDQLQAIAEAATPGPWRPGDWHATFGTLETDINVIERAPDYGPFPAVRQRDLHGDAVLQVHDEYDEEAFPANVAHITTWNPATVLRGLAEDRDILARHRSDTDLESQRDFWECVVCSHEIECNSDRYRDHNITVPWPCPEIASLARRHGVTP